MQSDWVTAAHRVERHIELPKGELADNPDGVNQGLVLDVYQRLSKIEEQLTKKRLLTMPQALTVMLGAGGAFAALGDYTMAIASVIASGTVPLHKYANHQYLKKEFETIGESCLRIVQTVPTDDPAVREPEV